MIGLMVDNKLQIGDSVTFEGSQYIIVEIGNVVRKGENKRIVYVIEQT